MMNSIILLHGALGSQQQVIPLAKELTGFDVHTFDLPGHGSRSNDTDNFTMDSLVSELNIFIDQNQIANPVVFGYSMGGYVALLHTLLNPGKIKRIITLATKFDWTPDTALNEAKQLDTEVLKTKVPDFVNLLIERHGTHWERLVTNTRSLMLSLGSSKPLNETSLKLIDTKSLICVGDKDKMVSIFETKSAVNQLSNGTFKLLDNTTHPFERLNYKMFAEVILQFA